MTCKEWSIDFCSDCLITQTQNDVHHPFDHAFYGYRVSSDYRSQSDAESDEVGDDTLDDLNASENVDYDKDILIKTEIN